MTIIYHTNSQKNMLGTTVVDTSIDIHVQ